MDDFAIIVPNLNQSHFLPTALESLKCQNASVAIALMDGGSTDEFFQKIEPYSDLIAYQQSQPDGGQSAAINTGSQKIEGKFTTWLNADDYFFPYTLKHIKDAFERYPDIDIVYGDAIHVDPDGNFLSYFPPAHAFNHEELTYNCFICQPACFMRSEAFATIGRVDPALHYTMDWDLWCRLAQEGCRFLYVPKPLAAVRYYPETKTLGGNYKRLLELYRIEKNYGRRFFKRSWLGAYYYGLHFKKRNLSESAFFHLFKGLYTCKQYLKNTHRISGTSDLLYGFHRWKPIVEGRCEIHFPWFGHKPWQTLRLQLAPAELPNQYRVSVDGTVINTSSPHSDDSIYKLDHPAAHYALITIENLQGRAFKLKSFRVE